MTRLVVDLSAIEFVGGSSPGALSSALEIARTVGCDLRLATVPDQVRGVLSLTTPGWMFR